MAFDYPQSLNSLGAEQRLHFYELLAHNLTVSIRAVLSDENISDAEKIDRMKLVNEIQHRVTSKVYVLRLQTHEWSEDDAWQMISHYVAQNNGIEPVVNAAIKYSYDGVARS